MFLTNASALLALILTAPVCGLLLLCSLIEWLGRLRRRHKIRPQQEPVGVACPCLTGRAPRSPAGLARTMA
jgi:hypothetical protein